MRRITLYLLCCAAAAQNPTFRSQTSVVQVPVTVVDMQGRNVEGLEAHDFRLLNDGVPQAIKLDTFDTGVAGISLALLIQTSGISQPALVKIRRIGGMIQPLVTGTSGEAAVVTFDDEIRWQQDFTSSSDNIQRAMRNLKPGAYMQARMLDAIAEVAERMKEREGRKVLLIVSESRDRGSKLDLARALDVVQREGIEVFAAHYSAYATTWIAKPEDLPPPSGPDFLAVFTELARLGKTSDIQALTQSTGGADYPFLKERALENAIERLGADVHSQYILSFAPPSDAKGMHRIDVTVPGRSDVRIRARNAWAAD